jgi:carboxymethylenebutenolidase
MRLDLVIDTADGTCPASLHVPDAGGAWPGVILFPDAGGRREVFAAMADHLADLGYAVLLPDIYYREGDWTPFDISTVFTVDAERERLFSMVAKLGPDAIASDTGAYLDALAAHPQVTDGPVGTTGYCLGGRASLIAAGHHPGRIGAAASFHGGNLAVDGDPASPHLLADRLGATVYVAGAQDDDAFPAEQYERLDAALTAAGVPHTLETYPAGHGFAVPDNPTFDTAAHERHWAALERLYATALQAV